MNRVKLNDFFKDNYRNKENKSSKSLYVPQPKFIKYINNNSTESMIALSRPSGTNEYRGFEPYRLIKDRKGPIDDRTPE